MKIKYILLPILTALFSNVVICQIDQYVTMTENCDRLCLERFVDKYLEAVIAHDPARVPLSEKIKFTENGQRLEVGDGLWNTASARGSYKLYIADPQAGQVGLRSLPASFGGQVGLRSLPASFGGQVGLHSLPASFGGQVGLRSLPASFGGQVGLHSLPASFGGQVGFIGTIRENNVPAILALRLKIENNVITEIETIVARDTAGALRIEKLVKPHPVFLETVPVAERASREELIKTANMYFTGLEKNDGKGVYPFTENCNRIENGNQTTNNPSLNPGPFDVGALGCKEQFESGFFRFVTRIRDRRFMVVDEERGLVFAFVFFDHAGNVHNVQLTNGTTIPIGVIRPWTWEIAELFKIEKGLIRQIEAIVWESPYGMNSGWSSWEEGLSGRVRR
ncbi:MAG: hypothetical protein ABSB78_01975 [Bacteroidota bacterium]